MGEDMTSLSASEVHQLEQQLEVAVNRVRTRKVSILYHSCDESAFIYFIEFTLFMELFVLLI